MGALDALGSALASDWHLRTVQKGDRPSEVVPVVVAMIGGPWLAFFGLRWAIQGFKDK